MRGDSIMPSFFSDKGQWFRGNLHSHTTRSDGTCPPQQQIDDYRAQGYDFLAITDHNIMDSHKLPTGNGFCLLPGWERDITYSPTKCLHLVGISSKSAERQPVKEALPGIPGENSEQQLVDDMLAEGEFVILAHPIWSRMEPWEVMSLKGYHAIEIYNTGCERLCHAGHAEVYWDMLLRSGRRVYGIACDDTHGKTRKSDRFGGWVMVKANSCSHDEIMRALYSGNFYSSMGPEIYDWGIDDDTVYIECSPCEEVHFITYPPRGMAYYKEDRPLTKVTYRLKGWENYIRAECIDEKGKVAWTNAIFLEDYFRKS